MGFKPFRHTYLQSVISQTLLNHILNKNGDGGGTPLLTRRRIGSAEWREAHGEERRGRRTQPHARGVRRRNLHRRILRWVRPLQSTGSSPEAIDQRPRKKSPQPGSPT